jgi:hypothetical protein
MVEWENSSRNVGLQHEAFPHYGYSNLIVAKGAKYGRENTNCDLKAKLCEVGMGIHKHYECNTSF